MWSSAPLLLQMFESRRLGGQVRVKVYKLVNNRRRRPATAAEPAADPATERSSGRPPMERGVRQGIADHAASKPSLWQLGLIGMAEPAPGVKAEPAPAGLANLQAARELGCATALTASMIMSAPTAIRATPLHRRRSRDSRGARRWRNDHAGRRPRRRRRRATEPRSNARRRPSELVRTPLADPAAELGLHKSVAHVDPGAWRQCFARCSSAVADGVRVGYSGGGGRGGVSQVTEACWWWGGGGLGASGRHRWAGPGSGARAATVSPSTLCGTLRCSSVFFDLAPPGQQRRRRNRRRADEATCNVSQAVALSEWQPFAYAVWQQRMTLTADLMGRFFSSLETTPSAPPTARPRGRTRQLPRPLARRVRHRPVSDTSSSA